MVLERVRRCQNESIGVNRLVNRLVGKLSRVDSFPYSLAIPRRLALPLIADEVKDLVTLKADLPPKTNMGHNRLNAARMIADPAHLHPENLGDRDCIHQVLAHTVLR